MAQVPELTGKVPFAYAWEFTPNEAKERKAALEAKGELLKEKLSPAPDLKCRANTYGFPHGIYSKYSFFAAYLDRCIAQRLPAETPPPGKPVKLKPWVKEDGWVGDYNPVGEWNAIAPFKEAKGMSDPQWLPDAYAAWMWRAYHTHKPDLRLTAPVVEYKKSGERKECGFGYGGPVPAGKALRFAAETTGAYVTIEFHDGDKIVGTVDKAPWQIEGIKLGRGLHALFAVGVTAQGTRRASRPAFLIAE